VAKNKTPTPRKHLPKPGRKVVLEKLPPGLIDGLPRSDQNAISAIVGVPIRFLGCEEDGRFGLEFVDESGIFHSIYVDREYVRAAELGPRQLTKRRK
jgi:hypothetical protein